jgi:UrcA family protein
MKNLSSALAAAGMAVCLCSFVHAGPATIGRSEKVRFADLDLNRQVDAVILYQRIQRAAAHVCSDFDHPRLFMQRVYADCRQLAIEDAVSRIDRPALSAHARSLDAGQRRI